MVATLTAVDPDGVDSGFAAPFTYALVSGEGDTDNAAFTIEDDQLKISGSADFEAKSSYSVRIQVTDKGGLTYATSKTITITDVNEAPTVAKQIPDQAATENSAFSFQFADDTFADEDIGDALTYTATLADGSALPSWLTFNGATRTFSGTPLNADVGKLTVNLTATDKSDASVSDTFAITVGSSINIVLGDNRNNSNLTGSPGADEIYGLGGNDRLFGLAGDDLLDGGRGRDQMFGGVGNDVYIVDDRNDQVFEFRNQGIDEIRTTLSSFTLPSNAENLTFIGVGRFTGSGNDLDNRIVGGSSQDTLSGRNGNDQLYGQAGRDVLIGGSGQDWLYGGADADRFVFSSVSDIGLGARGDVIADFERGVDLIDLRDIDANTRARRDQSFNADLVEDFTGTSGQLRVSTYADGVIVAGDVNGDRRADFELKLVGVTTLTAWDFLL